MKQVLQNVRSGPTRVKEIPAPLASPGHIVVAAMASVISAGTERYVVDLARKSLVGKALQRPQDVKRIFQKLKQEGIRSTFTQVSAKLDDPMPLGYSAAGIVLECGAGVQEFKPGDRIATAAAHSAISVVGRNLCDPSRWSSGVYGEWMALSAVVAYFGVTDLNMNQAAANAVTAAYACGDLGRYRCLQSSAMAFFVGMAFSVSLVRLSDCCSSNTRVDRHPGYTASGSCLGKMVARLEAALADASLAIGGHLPFDRKSRRRAVVLESPIDWIASHNGKGAPPSRRRPASDESQTPSPKE